MKFLEKAIIEAIKRNKILNLQSFLTDTQIQNFVFYLEEALEPIIEERTIALGEERYAMGWNDGYSDGRHDCNCEY